MTSTTTGAPTGVAPPEPTTPATPAAKSRRSGGHLGSYLLVRFLLIFPTIFILVTTVFVLMRATGDPITASLGGRLTRAQLDERIAEAGYDRPILVQYLEYLGNIFRGDFGTTISDNRPVTEVVMTYGAATLELAFYALLVALLVGIPLGRIAAARRDKGVDASLRITGILAYATPVFFAGILLKLIFSVWLGWLPVAGRASTDAQIEIQRNGAGTGLFIVDAIATGDPAVVLDVLEHAILPALALGLLTGGIFLRLVRTNVIGTLSTGYVEAARSRGVNERRLLRQHAWRPALVPIITVIGLQVALLLSGAVLTEKTFEWKGLGFQLVQYLLARDFVAVQGLVVLLAVVVALTNFVVDVIAALVDPRIRY
ncbi:ABC transporter permease [Cellulomonas xylanilytica]|uniref:Peptide ABC transporter permease n=1 Tax=Cellulomonas xylanilytica TaxID=233583 RepID=A0A510UZX1_9CELL|nr:ABC transporter permease [Cellulomonas xylanilytica]GEK20214.1 peptide ABC transporter permease [Cellulomonas xylanilytica]